MGLFDRFKRNTQDTAAAQPDATQLLTPAPIKPADAGAALPPMAGNPMPPAQSEVPVPPAETDSILPDFGTTSGTAQPSGETPAAEPTTFTPDTPADGITTTSTTAVPDFGDTASAGMPGSTPIVLDSPANAQPTVDAPAPIPTEPAADDDHDADDNSLNSGNPA